MIKGYKCIFSNMDLIYLDTDSKNITNVNMYT